MNVGDLPPATLRGRVEAVDRMRGFIMIVMALDHVRDYFSPTSYPPNDLTQASAALFLTRWITHFCAPAFVFLAGTSAWLYWRARQCTRGDMQRFLVSRGLWLILLELTVINWSWTFSFFQFEFVQVIWAIGWSMIVLAALLWLPLRLIVAFGALCVFGHNLLDGLHAKEFGDYALLWAVLHEQYFTQWHGLRVGVLYPLLPWIGVMALGFAFGRVLELELSRRAALMRRIGLAAIVLFLALRLSNFYGEPIAWEANPRGLLFSALGVLNVSKYPPSLLYLLMTLGPVLLVLPWLEQRHARIVDRIAAFGRVPPVFLPAAHSADSCHVLAGRVACLRGRGQHRHHRRRAACGLPAESAAGLCRLDHADRRAVLSVPLVRRLQAPTCAEPLARLSVNVAPASLYLRRRCARCAARCRHEERNPSSPSSRADQRPRCRLESRRTFRIAHRGGDRRWLGT